jgi:hypothetical protein
MLNAQSPLLTLDLELLLISHDLQVVRQTGLWVSLAEEAELG